MYSSYGKEQFATKKPKTPQHYCYFMDKSSDMIMYQSMVKFSVFQSSIMCFKAIMHTNYLWLCVTKISRTLHHAGNLFMRAYFRQQIHWVCIVQPSSLCTHHTNENHQGKNKLIPSYLANFLIHYTNRRPGLRSESANLLTVARTQRSHGDNAFCVAGPRLWESLPIRIRNSPSVNSFKKVLKTHLFPSTWFACPGVF